MSHYILALCWALPMLGLAILNVYGLVSDDMMKVVLAVLPVLAVISINRRQGCPKVGTGN